MGKQKDFRHIHHISHKKKDKKIDKTSKPSRSSCHEGYLKSVEGVVQAELESAANTKKFCRKVRKEVERFPLLAKAVFLGCERVVDNILEAGENVNVQVQGGKTPLIIAVENRFPGIVQKLLKRGADPKLLRQDGRNALMIAVSNNDNRSFTLIWNYWDKSNFCELNHSDSRGFTVLTIAAEHGHSQITHFLLSLNGIEIDKQTKDGRTPLMFAVKTGQSKTVQKFLTSGSDVALEDKDGATAVCLALRQSDTEIKSLLIESLDSKSRDVYVKKRIELLLKPRTEENLEAASFYKDVLFRVILEIRRGFEDGVSLLEKHRVFNGLVKCLKKHQQDTELLKSGFHLAVCIMYDKAEYSRYIVEELAEQYIGAKGADFALKTMNIYRLKSLSDLRGAAFLSIHAGSQCKSGKMWLKTNYFQILPFLKEFKLIFPTLTFWADGESIKAKIMFDRFEEYLNLLEKDIKENPLPPIGRNEATVETAIPATQMVKRNRSVSNISAGSTASEQQWSVVSNTKSNTSKLSSKAPRNQTLKKDINRQSKGLKLQTKLQRKIAVKKINSKPNIKYIPGLSSGFPALPTDVKLSQTGYADALKKNLQSVDVVQHTKDNELHSKKSGNISSKSSYSMVVSPCSWTCNASNGEQEQKEDTKVEGAFNRDNAVTEEPKTEELQSEDRGKIQDLWTLWSRVTHIRDPFNLMKLFMNLFMSNVTRNETCDQRIQTEMAESSISLLPEETFERNSYYREFPSCDIIKEKYDVQTHESSLKASMDKSYFQRELDKKDLYDIFAALGIKIPPEENDIRGIMKAITSENISAEKQETSSPENHAGEKIPDIMIEEKNLKSEFLIESEREKDTNIEASVELNSTFDSEPCFDFNDSKTSSEKDIFYATGGTFIEKMEDYYCRNAKRKYSETCSHAHSLSFCKEEVKETGNDLILSSHRYWYQGMGENIRRQTDRNSAFYDSPKSEVNEIHSVKGNKNNYLDPQSFTRKSDLANTTMVCDTMHHILEKSFHISSTERVCKSYFTEKTKDTKVLDENNSQIMLDGIFCSFNPKPCKRKVNLNNALLSFSIFDSIAKLRSVSIQKYIIMYQRLLFHKIPLLNRFLSNAVQQSSQKVCNSLISSPNKTIRFGKLDENKSSLDIQKDYNTLISHKLKFDWHYRTALLRASGKYPILPIRRRGMKFVKVMSKETRKHLKITKLLDSSGKDRRNSEEDSICNFNSLLYGYKSHFINCESDSRWYKILRRVECCVPLSSFLTGFTKEERRFLTDNTLHELVCSSGKIIYSAKEEHVLRAGDFGTYIGLMANGNPAVVKEFPKTSHDIIELLSKKRSVSHRNMAEFYCLCSSSTDQKLIAVTELLEYSLPEYIRANVNTFDGKILVQQLVEALRYLHKRQIVHGFLKPSNVMVSIDYRLKLTDFFQLDVSALKYGLYPKEGNKSRAPVGQSLSDICWRPYELVTATTATEARRYLTAASDVQVAGMLIYYILSRGEHPFGSTTVQCLENIRRGFAELGPKPEDIESRDLIQDMIKRVPSARPAIGTVTKHPYLWDIGKRFKFLVAVSKKIEFFTRKPTKIAEALEGSCMEARNWTRCIPYNLLRFISQSTNKTYADTFLDLLLFFLATHNNFEMMPSDIKFLVQLPSTYLLRTFPLIFMSVYSVVRDNPCAQKQMALQEYF